MKGDFTRDTFDSTKHFSRVLMQQGRVTLDADHNEQVAIQLRYLRMLARDIIGPYAGPAGADGGFLLAADSKGIFTISKGRYYVDGILVENEQDCLYTAQANSALPAQPDYPVSGTDDPLLQAIQTKDTSQFGVYLDVWERHITRIEDSSIWENALGGPDTCTRAKVVWQVKALKVSNDFQSGSPCADLFQNLTGTGRPLLAARVNPGEPNADPCITPPASKYRGVENQLYRVEIHQGGAINPVASQPAPTFKWSRDNGSVVAPWLGSAGNDLEIASTRGFAAGNWVELSDDTLDLLGEPGVLVQLAKVEGDTLSVDPASVPQTTPNPLVFSNYAANPKVRRWEQTATNTQTLQAGAVPIVETPANPKPEQIVWIDLEDGIQIQFSANGTYRTGDYWLIPARVATGKIEWPLDVDNVPTALPPHGIEHHYAPLGFVEFSGGAVKSIRPDCLCKFYPLNDCEGYYSLIAPQPGPPAPRPTPFPAPPVPRPAAPAQRKAPKKRPA